MENIKLDKEIKGSDLIRVLRSVSDELGFIFGHLKLSVEEGGGGGTYRATKVYHEKNPVEVIEGYEIPLSFDTTPCLSFVFPDLIPENIYSSITCQTKFGTLFTQEVNINQYPKYKPDYDAFVTKIRKLVKQY